jgi:hypothetical protein
VNGTCVKTKYAGMMDRGFTVLPFNYGLCGGFPPLGVWMSLLCIEALHYVCVLAICALPRVYLLL